MQEKRELFVVGPGAQIHASAELGCLSGRDIAIEPLRIGSNAVIRSNTVIYTNTRIGDDLQTGHNVVIREENVLGDRCWVWSHTTIDYGCRIGNRVRIHNHIYIAQNTVIEDDVGLAPGVKITNDRYPITTTMDGPVIKRGAVIGANATILPGVTIGEYALVGAGSVVTKDVPPGMLAYGSPARVHGERPGLKQ